MESSNFKIIKRFGPSVLKVKIPENIVKTLNDHFDKIILDKNESKRLNHGEDLVGDVTQELKLEKEIMEKSGWIKFLGNNIDKWMKEEMGRGITKFTMLNSWIVRQYKNEYNPTHWHNGHISGAGYLKVPKNLGKHYQKKQNRDYRGGNLQLIHGSRMFLSHSTLNIVPEVGDFYFFPNYLMHTVFPFKDTDEERRCISFNCKIDDELYNVYGG